MSRHNNCERIERRSEMVCSRKDGSILHRLNSQDPGADKEAKSRSSPTDRAQLDSRKVKLVKEWLRMRNGHHESRRGIEAGVENCLNCRNLQGYGETVVS